MLKIPFDIRDELWLACLLLPVAQGHLRWPIVSELSATDATCHAGGTTRARVSQKLASTLFDATEYVGSHMRLHNVKQLSLESTEAPDDPILEEVTKCAPWRVINSRYFSESAHVNLQEAQEFADEVRRRAVEGRPGRFVNLSDSK
eukprot:12406763-Karenia_brevis.AAC.1